MKLIENNWWLSKQVEYKGNLLIVPVWANWVATDENGVIVAFSAKPTFDWWGGCFCDGETQVVGKMQIADSCYLKESLVYVGEEQ